MGRGCGRADGARSRYNRQRRSDRCAKHDSQTIPSRYPFPNESSIILPAVTQTSTDELARFRVDGKVAVVSGGTGAIGSRLALALARSGARIAVLGRTAEQAKDLRDEIQRAGS